MRGLADPDSKLFSLLNKMTLIMELNLWVMLCCLPVVTAGAAISSMHTVLLKIYREEEKRVAGDFFRAMKGNLKKSTAVWVLFLGYLGLLAGIWAMTAQWGGENAVYAVYGLLVAAVISAVYLDWVLILQSRYEYTLPQCLKYAVLAWLQYPGSTFVYLVSLVIPVLFCLSLQTLPVILLGGIALPHLVSTTLYSRVFDQMEGIPARMPKL
jgi:uncharacterized membrane protein YesL